VTSKKSTKTRKVKL